MKPPALKLFVRTLRAGCDEPAARVAAAPPPSKYRCVETPRGKHDRFWLQGCVVQCKDKLMFVLDDGTGTLDVNARNCASSMPQVGQYMMAIVQMGRKGYATALQLFDLTAHAALRQPLWDLEVPDCWASECE